MSLSLDRKVSVRGFAYSYVQTASSDGPARIDARIWFCSRTCLKHEGYLCKISEQRCLEELLTLPMGDLLHQRR